MGENYLERFKFKRRGAGLAAALSTPSGVGDKIMGRP